MNTQLVAGILTTVRAVLGWLTAKQNGDRSAALAALQAADLRQFGFDNDTLEAVLLGRAALTYLTQRGVIVDEAIALIEAAEAEGRDVTTEEVREQLDLSKAELDETEELINQMG